MRDALVNGKKQGAFKTGRGKCLCCGADVIARCGDLRCHHWAHKSRKCTYSLKELKTPWHIKWQECFQEDWQEVRCSDETNSQCRIADIKTPHGLVVEFQHSPISSEERLARENFHKTMIWVVDGTRCKNDFSHFIKNKNKLEKFFPGKSESPWAIYTTINFAGLLPEKWLDTTVPVYLDFRSEAGASPESEQEKLLRNFMRGFFEYNQQKYVVAIPHEKFVERVKQNWILEILPKPFVIQQLPASPSQPRKPSVRRNDVIPPGTNSRKANRMKKTGARF